jgi:hypothetical protein
MLSGSRLWGESKPEVLQVVPEPHAEDPGPPSIASSKDKMPESWQPPAPSAGGDAMPTLRVGGDGDGGWQVPEWLTFFRLHMLYQLSLGLVGGIIIFLIERGRFAFIDTLFTAFSCSTVTGLMVLNQDKIKLVTEVGTTLPASFHGAADAFSSMERIAAHHVHTRLACLRCPWGRAKHSDRLIRLGRRALLCPPEPALDVTEPRWVFGVV